MAKVVSEIKVRGFHLDKYLHVNNARYLEFLEEARWEYYKEVFDSGIFEARNWAFIIVEINIRYRKSAYMHDVLQISVAVHKVDNASITLVQEIKHKTTQARIASAKVRFAIVDTQTNKPLRLTPEMLSLLT